MSSRAMKNFAPRIGYHCNTPLRCANQRSSNDVAPPSPRNVHSQSRKNVSPAINCGYWRLGQAELRRLGANGKSAARRFCRTDPSGQSAGDCSPWHHGKKHAASPPALWEIATRSVIDPFFVSSPSASPGRCRRNHRLKFQQRTVCERHRDVVGSGWVRLPEL